MAPRDGGLMIALNRRERFSRTGASSADSVCWNCKTLTLAKLSSGLSLRSSTLFAASSIDRPHILREHERERAGASGHGTRECAAAEDFYRGVVGECEMVVGSAESLGI